METLIRTAIHTYCGFLEGLKWLLNSMSDGLDAASDRCSISIDRAYEWLIDYEERKHGLRE